MNLKKVLFPIIRRLGVSLGIQKLLYDCYYRMVGLIKHGDPYFVRCIAIEINSGCNRRCSYCPVSLSKDYPNNLMSEELFSKILNQLAHINFSGTIMYHFYNEPTMDSRLATFVRETSTRLPNAISRLFTSGDYLSDELIDELFEAGMNDIHITDHNRTKGRISRRFSEALKKYRHRITVDEGLGTAPDRPIDNRGGLINLANIGATPYLRTDCKIVWEEVKIDYQGNVLLCTNDFNREHIFGNVNEDTFIAIWKNEHYAKVRNNLRNGKTEFDICTKCNYATPTLIK